MNSIFLRNLALIATLAFAIPAAAQAPLGGRGSPSAAASSGPGSRGGRPPTDPRPSIEAVEARLREIGVEDLKLPPKRDYKIEVGEPQKVKLFRADPKLFENKFVATLVLARREQLQNFRTGDPRQSSDFPEEQRNRVALDDPNNISLSKLEGRDLRFSISPVFKELAKHCPAEQLPEPALVGYLTSAECDRDVRGMFNEYQKYSIYASTEKEAEARARAIIRLHDCAVSRPLQQYFYAEGKKYLAKALAGCNQFDMLTAEVRAEEEKLATPSEVSTDILSQLKAQKIMVAVELAGLNARVKACDGMLSDPKKLEVSAMQSISDMKVKAEIERIGTKEKLDQIIFFIAEGDKREAINVNLLKLNGRRASAENLARNAANLADTYAYLAALYSPRPVEGNKVLIHPIEWTEQ